MTRHNRPLVWMCYVGVASLDELNASFNKYPDDPFGAKTRGEVVFEGFVGPDSEQLARDFAAASDRPCYVAELEAPELVEARRELEAMERAFDEDGAEWGDRLSEAYDRVAKLEAGA